MKIEEINDSNWQIPLKQALAEGNLHKKLKVTVLIRRVGYDSHMRSTGAFFLQEVELEIPDIEEFAPFYLRIQEPQKLGRIYMEGLIFFVNLLEGSTQPLSFNIEHAKNIYHTRIKKIGEEKQVTVEQAKKLANEGKIFLTCDNDVPSGQFDVRRVWRTPK